jgi:hypothetical protein
MLRIQNVKDNIFVLLFLYSKNINIKRPTTERDVAVYGMIRSSSFAVAIALPIIYYK